MSRKFTTSDLEIQRISEREGYRAKAYRPIPGKDAQGRWKSNITVGFGQENELFPGTPAAIVVREGLTIDRKTAWDALCFFVYNVVDPLVHEHFNPQTQDEHDACASFVYNIRHARLRKNGYTLPKLVCQEDRSPEARTAIAECWLQYCLTDGGESGLARRRLIELMDFNSIHAPPGVVGLIEGMRVIRVDKGQSTANAVWMHPGGKFALTADPFLLMEMATSAAIPAAKRGYTTDEFNARELARLRGEPVPEFDLTIAPKPAPAPVVPVEAPNLIPAAPPKPMEQSTTAKGMSNKDSGKETAAIGAVTTGGVMAMLPYAEKIAAFAERTPPSAILISLGAVTAVVVIVGLVRWWYGRMQMYEGRQKAREAKI